MKDSPHSFGKSQNKTSKCVTWSISPFQMALRVSGHLFSLPTGVFWTEDGPNHPRVVLWTASKPLGRRGKFHTLCHHLTNTFRSWWVKALTLLNDNLAWQEIFLWDCWWKAGYQSPWRQRLMALPSSRKESNQKLFGWNHTHPVAADKKWHNRQFFQDVFWNN